MSLMHTRRITCPCCRSHVTA